MNRNIVLLKTLMLSTSSWNTYKYCNDKKVRAKVVGGFVGRLILYAMLMFYSIMQCVGYGQMGLASSIPVLCALVIAGLSFFLTFFKTNGYLFNFKEYDMLMSLPWKPSEVAACKFLYMYIKSLPWYLSVSLSMMVVYGIYTGASVAVYPVWIILSFVMPVIPMLIASFFGFLIARAGAGFRNKTIVQTVISFVFIFLIFAGRFFIENMFREDKTAEVLSSISAATDKAASVYLPARWFASSITTLSLLDMALLVVVSSALFAVVFIPVGRSYRKINSALKANAASRNYKLSGDAGRNGLKPKSLLNTIAFKEFKRMTGSPTYMTNALIGELFCVIAGIAVLFVDIDTIIRSVLQDAPVTKEMLYPAIPFIVYFFVGMVATTAFTPSLEGRNYWIVKSLPIPPRKLYQGKMLFNMYLTVPFAVFATVMISIKAGVPVLSLILSVVLILCLCAFSTCWGAVCGIKHMKLDWENEVEVIKQGTGVTLYLLPNMFVTMGLIAGVVALGTVVDYNAVTGILIAVVSVLTVVFYKRALAKT
ncbi:ABC-2 type transport system permease protein [Ruminococcaceae bacterium YRB3002]|nr:ABC-2 type transport system permease protein [Ruminococcaceae bacterium YRB3002]